MLEQIANRELRRARVSIRSQGTPESTHLLINGVDVPCAYLRVLDITPQSGPIMVQVTLCVDHLDIEFDGDILLKAKPDGQPTA